jgi:hypothetical protein
MHREVSASAAFVIKAEELAALNYLPTDQPPPQFTEWINRGTDQPLRRTTIEMLLRTLCSEDVSASVERLHQSAGLRCLFHTAEDRDQFAIAFEQALVRQGMQAESTITAIFDDRDEADRAVASLIARGVPKEAVSVLWRTGRHVDIDRSGREGHGKLSVAAATAGGGIAGALLGIAIIAVPGVGAVAAAGAVALSAVSPVAAVSAAIGATGGAIARMLTDLDVDGNDANYFARQIQQGKVFVAIDLRLAAGQRDLVRAVFESHRHEASPPSFVERRKWRR